VHLVGYIIRINHDARSPERHMHCTCKLIFYIFHAEITIKVYVKYLSVKF